MTLLEDDEWGQWSNHEIARRCGVHNTFVGDVRNSLQTNSSEKPRTFTTKHGTEATMNTAKIGKSKVPDKSKAAVAQRRQDVADVAARLELANAQPRAIRALT